MGATLFVVLIYLEYLAIGLPDGLLGVAWPSIRAYFHMPLDALGLLPLTGTPGYLLAGFLSGRIMEKVKIPAMLAAGCGVTGMVLLFFTVSPSWYLIAAVGLISGFSVGIIDAGINLYVAQNLSQRQMQWLHASWGVGITSGPLIMTAALSHLHSWKPGYVLAGALQIILAGLFVLSGKLPGNDKKDIIQDKQAGPRHDTFSRPVVWRSMGLFFIYTGMESVLGLWAYSLLTESRGVAPEAAGLVTGGYWALFTISRVSAGFYTKHIKHELLVIICMLSGLAGITLLWLNIPGGFGIAGVILAGFSIAPVFPAIMSGTTARVGPEHTGNAVGMQMGAAALGAALMPGLAGIIARRVSLEILPGFMVILIIMFLLLFLTFLDKKVAD